MILCIQYASSTRARNYTNYMIFAFFNYPQRESGCEPWIAACLEDLDRFLDHILQRCNRLQPQQVLRLSRYVQGTDWDVCRRVRFSARYIRDLRRRVDF